MASKKDIVKILTVIKEFYPGQIKDADAKEPIMRANIWYRYLKDYETQDINRAVDAYNRSGKEFAPNPGMIIQIIKKSKSSTMTVYEAWDQLSHAVSNSLNNAGEEFNKLPEPVKRIVGSPGQLKQLAMMDLNEFNTFYKNQFKKEYREEIEAPTPSYPELAEGERELLEKIPALKEAFN